MIFSIFAVDITPKRMKENDVINYANIFLYRKKDVDTVHEAKV